MKKYFKKFYLITLYVLVVIFFFGLCSFALAANLQDAFSPTGPLESVAKTGAGYNTAAKDPTALISMYIQAVLSFLGVIFLILMIYGGFLWMTAKGNEQQVEKAKNLITAAVIGMVIVVSAYAIAYFVTQKTSEGALITTTPPVK